MSIHHLETGGCVIGSGGMWLPGWYEDERTARFAFRLSNEKLAELRDIMAARGTATTWGEVAKASEEERRKKREALQS